MRGTRSQALAEEALSLVYRVADGVRHMRQPWVWAGEMRRVERAEGESEADFDQRKEYGVVEVRYQAHADAAAQLAAIRFRVQAVLGEDAKRSIDAVLNLLTKVRNEVGDAVRHKRVMLHQADLMRRFPSDTTSDAYEDAKRRLVESERWIHAQLLGQDPAEEMLSKALNRVERALRDAASLKP
ncbi:TPA: hypothetical protein ACKPW8_004472 [Stenotrophomonas maltophilia]